MAQKKQQTSSIFYPSLTVGVGLALLGIYVSAPLGAALWVCVLVGAFLEPYPLLTGTKTPTGSIRPSNSQEKATLAQYEWLRRARTALILPSVSWIDIRRPLWWFATGLAGIFASVTVASHSEVVSFDVSVWWWVSPLGVWLTCIGLCRSWRLAHNTTRHCAIPHPGVVCGRGMPWYAPLLGLLVGAAVGGGAMWIVGIYGTPYIGSVWLCAAGAGVATWGIVTHCVAAPVMLKTYRGVCQASERWHDAFTTLLPKHDVSVQQHHQWGALTVDRISIDTSGTVTHLLKTQTGLAGFAPNQKILVYHAPLLNEHGHPQWGTVSTTHAYIASFPLDATLDITSPDTDIECVYHAITISVNTALDTYLQGRVDEYKRKHVTNVTPLHNSEAASATWCATIQTVSDGSNTASDVSSYFQPAMSALLGCPILADPVTLQRVIVGTIEQDHLDESSPDNQALADAIGAQHIDSSLLPSYADRLQDETLWRKRFEQIKKVAAKPPEPQWAPYQQQSFRGKTVYSLPFVTLQGSTPETFYGLEDDIAATLQGAPFVSVVPFKERTRGERHKQAFTIIWCAQPLPASPQQLLPASEEVLSSNSVEHWILTRIINRGFDASKLARPDVISVHQLSDTQHGALWKIVVRLYGGVTIADVRRRLPALRELWACSYVGVREGEHHGDIIVCAGTHPASTVLRNNTDRDWLTDMCWQQAFYDVGVVSKTTGELPVTLSVSTLPHNTRMTRIVFRLPSGVSVGTVKAVKGALCVSSGHAFIDVTDDADDPHNMVLCASVAEPLPDCADYDFALADELPGRVIVGSGVDGEPVVWNPNIDPHLLLVGLTGSGKSSAVQALLYGALNQGWDVAVADPIKGGADFKAFERFASIIVSDTGMEGKARTKAMLDSVYGEIRRRVELNAAHGVGSFKDLPEQVRPNRLIVFIDEFNSVVNVPSPVKPPQGASASVVADYNRKVAEAAVVADIGKLVADIAAQARSAGVCLVLIAQSLKRADLEKLPGGVGLRNNLSRILLGKATDGDRMAALRDPLGAPDVGDRVPRGRGVFESVTDRARLVQVWYADPPSVVYPRELEGRVSRVPWRLRIDEKKASEAVRVEGQLVDAADEVVDVGESEFDWSGFTFDDATSPVENTETSDDGEAAAETLEESPSRGPSTDIVDLFDSIPSARTDYAH